MSTIFVDYSHCIDERYRSRSLLLFTDGCVSNDDYFDVRFVCFLSWCVVVVDDRLMKNRTAG